MSAYDRFLAEKEQIDHLIDQGYVITKVTENLNGSSVEFEKMNKDEKEILHIGNADARKYFSSVIIKQRKKDLNQRD
jgi:hypothetical protein